MLLATALLATQALAQEALVAPPPRVPLPRPAANAPIILANDNRAVAGTRKGSVLTVALDVVDGAWQPEGPTDPAVPVFAFAEPGRAPLIPGPVIRAPRGTEVRLTLRSRVDSALVVSGLRPGSGLATDTVHLPARATREVRFRLDSVGSFMYWAGVPGQSLGARLWFEGSLNGAIVVDPPTGPKIDRVFVINEWFLPYRNRSFEVALVINGKAWPHTERITLPEGDSVRWSVHNGSGVSHPMHLHGFYYRVLARGTWNRAGALRPEEQPLVNTDMLHPGGSLDFVFTPTTPGNWVFHCHFAVHVGGEVSLVGSPADSAAMMAAQRSAAPTHAMAHGVVASAVPAARHDTHEMRGLVIGLHVLPKPGRKDYAAAEPAREIRLLAQKAPFRLYGGNTAYGFVVQTDTLTPKADSIVVPGPVLELERGKPVKIRVVNNLGEATGVHWHGLEIESFPDGVPNWSGMPGRIMPPIAPGDSFVAEFTPPRSGTFLYHSHLHELRQIGSGMYGALIVTDKPRDLARDHIVIAGGGGPPVFHKLESPFALVNGRRSPRPLRMTAGETNRIRLVSIHPDWLVSFTLQNDSTVGRWKAIAKDGADLPPALVKEQLARIEMGPGETADFEFTPPGPGRWRIDVRTVDPGWQLVLPVIVEEKKK